MSKKYELTETTKKALVGATLYQIRALRDFSNVATGDLGGWIEKEANLSHVGDAWVYDNARVSGNAQVYARIITATRSDGYTFLVCSDKRGALLIIAGCRYFTIPEAREHWIKTRGGTQLGEESLAIVDHLERMARITGLVVAEPVAA